MLILTALNAYGQDQAAPLGEPDSTLPEENPAWVAHAKATGFALSSLTSDDFSDLAFLPEVLGDRRLVQLGESGHGVSEFNTAKVRLVRFLHQEMGFDVIAFESSLFECFKADEKVERLTAEELMRECVFSVWHTEEIMPLFQYIRETRRTDRPLHIAGFDIQTSSAAADRRPEFWKEVLGPLDADYAQEAAQIEASFLAIRYQREALSQEAPEFVEFYQGLGEYIEGHSADLKEVGVSDVEVRLASRLAFSTLRFIGQLTASSPSEGTQVRDRAMAENLDWLMSDLYPQAKIMTWGHNFHLRHANQDVSPNPAKTMGAWVAEKRRQEMYTIGLYMRRGQATMPNRKLFNVAAPSSGSLESILGHVGEPYFFLDLARTASGESGEWVRQPIVAKTWGQADVTMTLADQYDGILMVDLVHPPVYK